MRHFLRNLKVTPIILLVVFALIVGACGSSDTSDTTAPTATAPDATDAPETTQATSAPTPTTTGTTAAADDCDGYPAQDVVLVVPYNPGGGFDTWARTLAPTLEAKLPNGVNVIVENRSGAGGLVGVTEVFGSDPDGYTMAITEPGVLATSLIAETTDTAFDQMTVLGQLTVAPEVIVIAADSEWETIEDVQAAAADGPLLMATGGVAAVNIVPFDAFGIPWTNVVHEGSGEAMLSIIRGDTDITVFPLSSVEENITSGDMKPLVVVGTPPEPGQPGADAIAGVRTLDEVTGITGIGSALEQHRVLVAAPGTPTCVVDILDEAIGASFQDPEFLDLLNQAGRIPVWEDAATGQAILENTITTLEAYADLLREQLSE